jgi:hypothetical protein
MTALLWSLGAVAVVTALIVIGARMKLPPPDPDWRAHVADPTKPEALRRLRILIIAFLAIAAIAFVPGLFISDRFRYLTVWFFSSGILLFVLFMARAELLGKVSQSTSRIIRLLFYGIAAGLLALVSALRH